jgi:2-oxoglutarate ferredoxin oxidoreductase subunit beta
VSPTTPHGNFERPFNLPYLVAAAGAVFVARWTTAHVRQLKRAMGQALAKRGFSFLEIIAPCPTNYGRRNKIGDGLAMMRDLRDHTQTKAPPPLEELNLTLGGEVAAGTFVDIERPTLGDCMAEFAPEGGK